MNRLPNPLPGKSGDPAGQPLYVISGGSGALGQQLIRTVMAQFEEARNPVHVFPKITTKKALKEVYARARDEKAIIIHSFVKESLRKEAEALGARYRMAAIDIVGPVIETLAAELGQEPLGVPGLYRDLHKSYFDRIEAINYTLDHDDGKNFAGWQKAEILLVGVSRVGKTPLSLYLSMLGWKVANIPLIPGIPPNKALFEVDQNRIVGLTIDPVDLIEFRALRKAEIGLGSLKKDPYSDPEMIFIEVEEISQFMRRQGYPIIETTRKPIESTASEVVHIVQRKLNNRGSR